MSNVSLEYIAAGGNRHPSAADWASGLLAFGAGNNVALWNPEDDRQNGIYALLKGHTDVVNAVKIYDHPGDDRILISAGADKTVRVWGLASDSQTYEEKECFTAHAGSVNNISILPSCQTFVTGSADGTLKVWEISKNQVHLIETISLKPRYLPLTTALVELKDNTIVLAVAGTATSIQLYARSQKSSFELQATLTGHEGWIRSLDFASQDDDIFLASASQDKYIRLWSIRKDRDAPTSNENTISGLSVAPLKKSLSNKSQQVGIQNLNFNVTFEALLIGHEDWIYTARWAPHMSGSSLTLLSASADNSLAIWQAEKSSGVWVCQTRLGEISAQKGSTTATGSAGGFWTGLWRPDGQGVASLGRTGSWRRWQYDSPNDTWQQEIGVSGHTQEVRGIAWAPDGSYIVSTGSDQTTRLFAEWKRDDRRSWHEFCRPQIHGYDLNCVDTLTANQLISGADEKLLRVFNKPKAAGELLWKLSGYQSTTNVQLPDAANIPVLGLSNKEMNTTPDDEQTNDNATNGVNEHEVIDSVSLVQKSTFNVEHPPFEEHLARHTLWPEHEKLYGHGYEISAVAANHDASLVATACKASSIDHAVIRIYECKDWRELKPPLVAHSLTVTSLAFSPDDRYLLSVGRDRQWSVFERDVDGFQLLQSNPKGHSRMILDCSWGPTDAGVVFATAGRDKSVKIWKRSSATFDCVTTLSADAPVTAVRFSHVLLSGRLQLAYGTEEGSIHIAQLSVEKLELVNDITIKTAQSPSATITALCWRPNNHVHAPAPGNEPKLGRYAYLAVASDDTSLRIFQL